VHLTGYAGLLRPFGLIGQRIWVSGVARPYNLLRLRNMRNVSLLSGRWAFGGCQRRQKSIGGRSLAEVWVKLIHVERLTARCRESYILHRVTVRGYSASIHRRSPVSVNKISTPSSPLHTAQCRARSTVSHDIRSLGYTEPQIEKRRNCNARNEGLIYLGMRRYAVYRKATGLTTAQCRCRRIMPLALALCVGCAQAHRRCAACHIAKTRAK
jgi:hypothetical protein